MFDLGIENGKVYVDGKFYYINVYINGEKIAALTKEKQNCKKSIDVSEKIVLPGLIDPHVHFALGVGTNVSRDDFYKGSVEGVYGGVTTYIDFLDPIKKADELPAEFEKRNKMAKDSVSDYCFHTTIANPVDGAQSIIEKGKEYGICSVKLFTTYADTDRRTYDDYIEKLLEASKKENVIVLVHAENDGLIDHSKNILVKDHENSRPSITENIEVVKLAQMQQRVGGHLYIVHVSAGSTVEQLKKLFPQALKSGDITLESCPHYFILNTDRLLGKDGYKYTMTPPIRPEHDRALMVENFEYISTIGTDHCPYLEEQKKHKYTSEIPMGIGGIRYSFLNMYKLFSYKCVDRFTSAVADIYHIPDKGRILPGFDGDIVIFDEKGETVVDDPMSVYYKTKFSGKIDKVLIRGNMVLENGQLLEHKGQYIDRCKI